jgi:tetratricopeptide (TPR) repeat protein
MNRNRTVVLGAAGVLALVCVLSAPGQDAGDEAKQLVQQAQDLAKDKKFEEAAAALRKAVRLAPRNDEYLAVLSDYEFKSGQYADGLEHALQAVKLNDKVGVYYMMVAYNALGTQDLDRAQEYCDLVLKRPEEMGPAAVNGIRALQELMVPRTYTLYWNLDPKQGTMVGGRLAVALPKGDLPYQTVTYEVTGAQGQRFVKGEVNDVLYVVPQGTKPFALTTKVTVKPYSYKKELEKAKGKALPEEARAFLGAGALIDPRSPALKKVAADLKADNPVDTVRNVLAWMKKNVEYKLGSGTIGELDFKSLDEIVERGHAECRGYSMLFTGLCRAAGVPSRTMWGLARVTAGQDQRFGNIASHNWSEFYVAGCGWVPVDPQRPETLGFLPTTDIRIFMDSKKTKTSPEVLPMLNLVSMYGDKLKFDESR